MATSRKTKPQLKEDDFPEVYVRFRTVLDGLEMTALRYCLQDKDAAKRIHRAKEIETMLMPIVKDLENRMRKLINSPEICPDGYYDCGGCCVPYQCPGGSA
jgi:hypothetical protein